MSGEFERILNAKVKEAVKDAVKETRESSLKEGRENGIKESARNNAMTMIADGSLRAIHIAFKEKAIMSAISQFSVHSTGNDILTGPLHTYVKEAYQTWNYLW